MAIDLTKPYTSQDFAQSLFPQQPQTPIQFPTNPNAPDLSQPINQLPSVTTAGTSPNMDPYPTSFLPNMNELTATPPPDQDIQDILGIMKPETKLQDEYRSLISQMPKREKPGWGNRIIAGLGTLQAGPEGSQAAADQYKYRDYYREMGDYNKKEAILKDLADNERQANVNNRQIGTALMTDLRGRKKLEEENRKNLERENISRRLNEIRALTEENMNLMPIFEKDGTVWLVDRKSGAKTNMGIKGQNMDEFQKMILNASMQRGLQASGHEQDMERDRQAQAAALARLQEEYRLKLKAAQDRKALDPLEEKALQYILAREMSNSNPNIAQYIAVDTASNSFKVRKPQEIPGWIPFVDTEGRNRRSALTYIDIVKYIYGEENAMKNIPLDVLQMAGLASEQSQRSTGAGPGQIDAARKLRIKAILERAGKDSSPASIEIFIKRNPGVK